MAYTDTFGRTWRYQPHPGHDLSLALQISRKTAEFGVNTDLAFSGHEPNVVLDDDAEPYLIKLPLAGWQLFSRCGHGAGDYHFLDDIDERVISMMLDLHGKKIDDPLESVAFDALTR